MQRLVVVYVLNSKTGKIISCLSDTDFDILACHSKHRRYKFSDSMPPKQQNKASVQKVIMHYPTTSLGTLYSSELGMDS